jgi:AraC family transcriptional regulator
MSQSAALIVGRPDGPDPRTIHFFSNVVELLEAAHATFERDREAAKASISRATTILRSEIRRHEAAPEVETGVGRLAGWQVHRLQAYVDAHLGESIQVKNLSGIVRRSTAHFCRAFKRSFGVTPHAYLTARRLDRAKRLMLESSEPLSGIAILCGFTDQAHLSKLFRQHVGDTPGAWRRRHAFEGDAELSAWAAEA